MVHEEGGINWGEEYTVYVGGRNTHDVCDARVRSCECFLVTFCFAKSSHGQCVCTEISGFVVRSLVLRDHLCSGNTFESSNERPVRTKYLSPYLSVMECLIRSFEKISIFILNNDCTIDISRELVT